MQFAVDGYRVEGAPIELVGDTATIRVGDGTTAGAGFTAVLAAPLTGSARLRKTDLGTLDFAGGPANSYAGGTSIDGGVLQISDDAQLGAPAGDLSFDGGTLRTSCDCLVELDRAITLEAGGGTLDAFQTSAIGIPGAIAGPGGLTVRGNAVYLTGENDYAGGTVIAGGLLQLGRGGTSGSIVGDVLNDGRLWFDRSDTLAMAGDITGSGSVRQYGEGTTILSGRSSYSGATAVDAGTLQAGAAGAFSAASAYSVAAGGTLYLADFDQRVARLENAGQVSLGQVPDTRLTVAGDYVGQEGLLHFTTRLEGDDSPTDRLVDRGRRHRHRPRGGRERRRRRRPDRRGHQADRRCRRLEASFTLAGITVVDDRPVVVAGAFAYALWQGSASDPADGDWYLRSQSSVQPGPPLVQPGVPVYEAYPRALLALNDLPTMQERIGNRYWQGAGNPPGLEGGPARSCPRAVSWRTGAPGRGSRRRGQACSPTRSSAGVPTTTSTSGSCRSAWTGRCARPTAA